MSVMESNNPEVGSIVKELTFIWNPDLKSIVSLRKRSSRFSPKFEFEEMFWRLNLYIQENATFEYGYTKLGSMNNFVGADVRLCRVDTDNLHEGTLSYYFTCKKKDRGVCWISSELKEEFRVDKPSGAFQSIRFSVTDSNSDLVYYCLCCSITLVQRRSRMTSLKDTDELSQDLENVLTSGEKTNVILIVKGREFRAHKLILTARSPWFCSMFQQQIKDEFPTALIKEENGKKRKLKCLVTPSESRDEILHIPDCDPDGFDDFLHYLYSGEVKMVTASSVLHIFNLANKFGVIKLVEICLEFMVSNLSVESFCDFATVGLQHRKLPLVEASKTFFTKNMRQIVVTDRWKKFCTQNSVNANELLVSVLNNVDITPKEDNA